MLNTAEQEVRARIAAMNAEIEALSPEAAEHARILACGGEAVTFEEFCKRLDCTDEERRACLEFLAFLRFRALFAWLLAEEGR